MRGHALFLGDFDKPCTDEQGIEIPCEPSRDASCLWVDGEAVVFEVIRDGFKNDGMVSGVYEERHEDKVCAFANGGLGWNTAEHDVVVAIVAVIFDDSEVKGLDSCCSVAHDNGKLHVEELKDGGHKNSFQGLNATAGKNGKML